MGRVIDSLRNSASHAAKVALPLLSRLPGPDSPSDEMPESFPVVSTVSETRQEILPVQDDASSRSTNQETPFAFRTKALELNPGQPLLLLSDDNSLSWEQYRLLRTKLRQRPNLMRLMLVSSAGHGDGKTMTSINLAGAFALKPDVEVLLVDGDLRKRSASRSIGFHKEPGFSDVLAGRLDLRDAILRAATPSNLFVLPAGTKFDSPGDLLGGGRATGIFEQLRERFQYVIVDTPPVGIVADYEELQALCDGVLIVLRQDHTERNALKSALAQIPPQKLLGVVMNGYRDWFLARLSHYSTYAEYYSNSQ